ncbi:MAG TPA: hypothetical protein VLX92_25885, partial [Kofleriaceae bacterium]|nr:hypothetical protein [Kofleriaceae bacterium]
MRTAWIVTLVVVLGGVASAQDAEDVPLAPPGTAPVGPPQGPAMVPPPYAYQPAQPVVLSAEDQELLARGEMPDGPHLGGGV